MLRLQLQRRRTQYVTQAIQYNSSVAMIRHPRFLACVTYRAATLTPDAAGHRQAVAADAEATAGGEYRLHAEQFYCSNRSNVGDSIIDFGSHFVGYLQRSAAASAARRCPGPCAIYHLRRDAERSL